MCEALRSDKEVMREHSIGGCWRFWDEILVLACNREQAVAYLRSTFAQASPFKLSCEQVSATRMQFLEVMLRCGHDSFMITPKYKSAYISKPLGVESAHPIHVHRRWPTALIIRSKMFAHPRKHAEDAIEELQQRFANNHSNPAQMSWLRKRIADDTHHASTRSSTTIEQCLSREHAND